MNNKCQTKRECCIDHSPHCASVCLHNLTGVLSCFRNLIQPEQCSYAFTPSRLDITLKKRHSQRWGGLEAQATQGLLPGFYLLTLDKVWLFLLLYTLVYLLFTWTAVYCLSVYVRLRQMHVDFSGSPHLQELDLCHMACKYVWLPNCNVHCALKWKYMEICHSRILWSRRMFGICASSLFHPSWIWRETFFTIIRAKCFPVRLWRRLQ